MKNVLRETYFPHRIITGKAHVSLPTCLNVETFDNDEATTLRVRSSHALTIAINDLAEDQTSAKSRPADSDEPWSDLSTAQDDDGPFTLTIDADKLAKDWLEVRITK